jgi:2-polyprenyl-6-methoxyphenol hydroxylase-like FAD-dependent oxidoreductase
MAKPGRIAVIGSGSAGMAAALFLKRLDYDVTIFDKVKNPQPLGAGVLIQPTGMFALDQLGILPEFLEAGEKINRLYGENAAGETVLNLNYNDLYAGSHGLGLHRGTIFNILTKRVQEASVELVNDCFVDRFVKLPGNKVEIFKKSESLGIFDALIIGDGKNSALRDLLDIKSTVHDYKWGALWTIVSDEKKEFSGELRQVYKTTKNIAGMLPIGKHPVTGMPSVSLFWSLRQSRLAHWKQLPLESWKDEFAELYPELSPLLNRIESREDVLFASYSHITMNKWHDDNILCIGDAGHAMSPQLGQGVSLGVYDAWVLSECLKKTSDFNQAFIDYSKIRRRHIRWMQFVSKLITPMFQSSGSNWAPYRDAVFKAIHKFNFTYQLMLGTLSGVQNGLFRKDRHEVNEFVKNLGQIKNDDDTD